MKSPIFSSPGLGISENKIFEKSKMAAKMADIVVKQYVVMATVLN